MTDREKMIEALAARMWKAQAEDSGSPQSVADARTADAFAGEGEQTRSVFVRYAAAVLKLVGPKPLVWTGGDVYAEADAVYGQYLIESGFRPDKTRWFAWIHRTHDDGSSPYFNGKDAADMFAAQAAAQAHADAAHWGNTPIGDLK